MQKLVNNLKASLKKAKTLLLLAHVEPDGDAIGSAIMFEAIAKTINPKIKVTKKITQTYRESVEYYVRKYKFLAGELMGEFDLVIALDTSTVERLPVKVKVDFNIDHHADNEKYATYNLVEKKAASAGVILYQLIKLLKIKLNKIMAEGLYLSVFTDTGNFSFANTDLLCFEIAGACLQAGINPHQVYRNINEQKSLASIKAFGQALNTIETFFNNRLILAVIDDEQALDNRTLIDYIRQEKQSEIAAVFVRKKDCIKVSLRSKTNIDISVIARHFNGGGHPFAAACKIYAADLVSAKKLFLDYIEQNVF